MSEIVADYIPHFVGECEVVSWDRKDGKTYYDVPVMYLRQVSEAEYREQHPTVGDIEPQRCHFWEVSVD